MSLTNLSPEEREQNLAKARIARIEKKQWAEANLRMDWEDEAFHRELASKYSYRLPNKTNQAAAKYVTKFLKAFKLDKEWYQDLTGFKNGKDEAKANPKMNAAEQTGLMLEAYDYEQRCKS